MSILAELKGLFDGLDLPFEVGEYSGKAPDEYCVATPLSDTFAVHRDNKPAIDINEVRISLFSKGNYLSRQKQIVRALLAAEFTITDRRYVGFENDTKYNHVAIDVAKFYEMEE